MSAAKTGDKGAVMEETLRRYFWRAGYFVARGLPFRLDGEDVTDVDLWLYERPAGATRRRLIVDIKNKRSPKAAERVIWTAGLRQAIQVDAALIATTDRRPATRRLARTLGVSVLDGEAISKLSKSPQLSDEQRLTGEQFDELLRTVDGTRGSSHWRDRIRQVRSSLIADFGIRSGNTAIGAVGFFAHAALDAQPGSVTAQTAIRAMYSCAASAAVSLDFCAADYAFSSPEDRRRAIANGIRYGQTEDAEALKTVRMAVGLAREFAPNGKAIARQIEGGFIAAANAISAEIVAEYVARNSSTDALFSAARSLEDASTSIDFSGFDQLPIGAKSLLGIFLDFMEVSRESIARCAPSSLKLDARLLEDISEQQPLTEQPGLALEISPSQQKT